MKKRIVSFLLFATFIILSCLPAEAASITWSGLVWDIRNDVNGPFGPGPNYFQGNGVSVDANGNLHLKLYKDANNHWQCPEIVSQSSFGYGAYKWTSISLVKKNANGTTSQIGIQNIDDNAVLGLFQYPPSSLGPDGTHEMDIELSRWGNTAAAYPYFMNWSKYLTYSKSTPMIISEQQDWNGGVYPAGYNGLSPQTHKYYRSSTGITWTASADWSGQFATLSKTGFNSQTISQGSMPVHINLWLTYGNPPVNTATTEIEVVINRFYYTP